MDAPRTTLPTGATTRGERPNDEANPGSGTAPAWHALELDAVAAAADTDLHAGLERGEAEARLARFGPNELTTDEPRSDLAILLSQFASPLIVILIVAAVVTVLIDHLADAAVIAAVLAINATIGFIQERKADRSVHALLQLAAPHSVAVRDGEERDLEARELVVGDVVLLTSGTRVPADLRLVDTTNLRVDESLLTGESEPVQKVTTPVAAGALAADRRCMAHMGSTVTSGRGRGVVVATAAATQLGSIAEQVRTEQQPPTPLQQRMKRFANLISIVVLAATAVAFGLGLAKGGELEEMFLTAVALAVAVIPEGLPVAFTIAMALGVHRMAQRRAIVRRLPAVETLGSTDTIGSDKTGTLTANRMTVLRVWTADRSYALRPRGADGRPLADVLGDQDLADAAEAATIDGLDPLSQTVRTGVLTNEADLRSDGQRLEHRGDPTESALLELAYRAEVHHRAVRDGAPALATVPFEPELRCSYTINDEDGQPVLRLKGAPEAVLERCTRVATADGPRPIDTELVLEAAAAMASRGLRVLAMAHRELDTVPDDGAPPEPSALTLTGMVGMQDPPRPGVRESIARCRRAGIRVMMITGDHAVTAAAIARELGLSDDGGVCTGGEMQHLSDVELDRIVQDVSVFARVAPDHKLRVVHALRRGGHVVAVTGDGVNDAPALKAADIGIAMGRDGTDVAREASDMVLTDDDFVSIAAAVEEGRVVFDNVRKVTYFLLSTGAASIVAILSSLLFGWPLPYTPAALLWLNVVTNGLQDVALAFEPGEPDVLDRPPRRRSEGVVNRVLWERTVLTGTAMAVSSLWLYRWAIDNGLTPDQQRGAALTMLVVAMALHVYTARSERRSLLVTHVAGNRFLLAASALSLTIHVLASHWAPTQALLRIAPVTAPGWARIAIGTICVAVVAETHKWLRSRR